jgi:hypothetical protein
MKTFKEFINEGLRDKMVGKSIESVLDDILKSNGYDKLLDSIEYYLINISEEKMYPDEVYFDILYEIGFDFIKKNLKDSIKSLLTNNNNWIDKILIESITKIENLKDFKDFKDFIFDIDDKIGDVDWRDQILRNIIKRYDLDKTKKIILEMIS